MCCRDIYPSIVLHWNYKGFTEFPFKALREESEVTDIYLKENLISEIPSDIGKLDRLESLYLSGNDIRYLPTEIGNLVHLKCLDLSGNRLSRIPDEIGEVRSLKFLILDENELTALPLRLAELTALRYLSVCDNKLQWLPQRPVYNYHHCEFRFWRNKDLTTVPYSLWYHMFRDQQTRSLNIGCLDHVRVCLFKHRIELNKLMGEVDRKIEIQLPHYNHVSQSNGNLPISLLELCKRTVYELLCKKAKILSKPPSSIYQETHTDFDENSNETLENNFNDKLTIFNSKQVDFKVNDMTNRIIITKKSIITPSDLLKNFYELPLCMKRELCKGPVSRCENIACKKAVFDYPVLEFCMGKIILIDNSQDIILSAVFCSKICANTWKSGKNVISWRYIPS